MVSSSARLRRLAARHCVWWCLAAMVLTLLQPFLFSHFRHDGWEDEGMFGVRTAGSTALFEPDERSDHAHELETTLYAATGAHIDVPNAFQDGLNSLLALVLLVLPLTVVLARLLAPVDRIPFERVPYTSGAPPPTELWRSHPPKTAPPLSI